MTQKTSALYSSYVIDGVQKGLTPGQMLSDCLSTEAASSYTAVPANDFERIIDESCDPEVSAMDPDPSRIDDYMACVLAADGSAVPVSYPESYTKMRMASALLDMVRRSGHFRLDDLQLDLQWRWNGSKVGNMAAFYASAEAAADLATGLGIRLSGFSCEESDTLSLTVKASIGVSQPSDDFFDDLPFRTEHPVDDGTDKVGGQILPDSPDWLIYVPFDDTSYRLGGSLLMQTCNISAPGTPQLDSPDYFIDCYEVIRELVEDGIVTACATVGRGGLAKALHGMTDAGCGIKADVSDLVKAVGRTDPVSILFSEVPGVLIQIKDADYDYVDAELLLQDVAFYPLGHPDSGVDGVHIHSSAKPAIQTILESLLGSQTGEGED